MNDDQTNRMDVPELTLGEKRLLELEQQIHAIHKDIQQHKKYIIKRTRAKKELIIQHQKLAENINEPNITHG